jgi:hypothetical protein
MKPKHLVSHLLLLLLLAYSKRRRENNGDLWALAG